VFASADITDRENELVTDHDPTPDNLPAGSDSDNPRGRSATSLTLRHVLTMAAPRKTDSDPPTKAIVAAGLLFRVREMLLREIDGALAAVGTSHPRHQVLSILHSFPNGLQLGEIAARAAVHPTTMTSTIDRLERDGFIERRPDPNDRRGTLAVATAKGRKSFERGHVALVEIDYGLANIPKSTIDTMIKTLDRLASELEQRSIAG
jgi:DNA-binding MarR family transcriptional regulator